MSDLLNARAIGMLKAIAKKLKYTDAQMAEALGMGGKNASDRYRKIKNGKSNISDSIILKATQIAVDNDILEFSVDYKPPPPTDNVDLKLDSNFNFIMADGEKPLYSGKAVGGPSDGEYLQSKKSVIYVDLTDYTLERWVGARTVRKLKTGRYTHTRNSDSIDVFIFSEEN